MLDRQKIFNDAVKGLWGQQAFSILPEEGCAYRGENDCKCAIGFLIPDENYDEEMEGYGVELELISDAIDDKYGELRNGDDYLFLMKLQSILHDDLHEHRFDPETFKAAALKFAKEYSLKVDVNLFETREK